MNRPGNHQPHTRPIAEALDANQALGRLLERLRESQRRHALILPALAPALRPWVQPGPLDDEGWTLLVPNAAVAAKMRHALPHLEAVLAEAGCAALPLRIKVRSGRP